MSLIFGILAALVAGVWVFGPANRTRSYRFLAHHGVRPGVVWRRRFFVWGLAMVLILLVAVVAFAHHRDPAVGALRRLDRVALVRLPDGRGVRRRPPLRPGLAAEHHGLGRGVPGVRPARPPAGRHGAGRLIPFAGLALFPTLVLAISRAWTRDWMEDLRGASRWLRLGAMMGGAAILMVSWYIGYRAWERARYRPAVRARRRRLANQPPPLSPERDAAPDYMRMLEEERRGLGIDARGRRGDPSGHSSRNWRPDLSSVVSWWSANRGLIEPLRRAAEKPELGFSHPELLDSPIDPRYHQLVPLILLLGLDSAERRSRGDLDGAWDDLRAVFGITAQISRSRGVQRVLDGPAAAPLEALEWALVWAADPASDAGDAPRGAWPTSPRCRSSHRSRTASAPSTP